MDYLANFVITYVNGLYGNTDNVITVQDGSILPDPATVGQYNLVWWNITDYPVPVVNPSYKDPNVEIVRVISKSGNTITILRGQEGTSASAKNTTGKTYALAMAITAKAFSDIKNELAEKANLSHTHTISDLPIASSGESSSTKIVRADDSRLSDARTPLAHTHTKSQITDFTHSHTISDLPVASSGEVSSTKIVRADDSRLSDARAPLSHTHPFSDITSRPTTLAGYGITDAVPISQKGAPNGVATLDSNGLIPSNQLPSYVDDIVEYDSQTNFPSTGSPSKIYVALDTGKQYRWSGSQYIDISSASTADTAYKLATARQFSITGDATASAVNFDGTQNVTLNVTLASSGVTAGTYPKVTVDSKGRVIAGGSLSASDIPNLDWSKITTGKPTTLAGYGITDAVSSSEVVTTATANKILKLDNNAKLPASITGNAETATKLATARSIALIGDISGSNTFDGSNNITITATLTSVATAGTYTKVTIDAKGRVTSGTSLSASDIPNLDWSKITTGKPTTLAGYGITDAVINGGSVPKITSGNESLLPSSSQAGQLYIAIDTYKIYRDTGTSWNIISSRQWEDILNKPSTYTPSAHTHTISDITNLSSFAGSTSITTLGTITTGVWQATAISPSKIATDASNRFVTDTQISNWNTAYTHSQTTHVLPDGTNATGTWNISITGTAGAVDWLNITNKPSTFTPSTHTHTISSITDISVSDGYIPHRTSSGLADSPIFTNGTNVGIGTTSLSSAGLVVAKDVSGAAIDVVSKRIINVGTPSADSDAVNKAYVDTAISAAAGSSDSLLSYLFIGM